MWLGSPKNRETEDIMFENLMLGERHSYRLKNFSELQPS